MMSDAGARARVLCNGDSVNIPQEFGPLGKDPRKAMMLCNNGCFSCTCLTPESGGSVRVRGETLGQTPPYQTYLICSIHCNGRRALFYCTIATIHTFEFFVEDLPGWGPRPEGHSAAGRMEVVDAQY